MTHESPLQGRLKETFIRKCLDSQRTARSFRAGVEHDDIFEDELEDELEDEREDGLEDGLGDELEDEIELNLKTNILSPSESIPLNLCL